MPTKGETNAGRLRLLSGAEIGHRSARGALPRRSSKRAPEGPQSSLEIRVTSTGRLNERVDCRNSRQSFIISEPKHVGGLADAPTPLEYLLSGAVGCYAAVFAFYAAKLGVDYESFEAVARTNFDVRGHMMPDAPPSGFQKVTIAIAVKSDAPAEKLAEIERLALAGCPGIATLARSGRGRDDAEGYARRGSRGGRCNSIGRERAG